MTLKALHLLVYLIEEGDSKELFEDAIFYNPEYKAGDIIDLVWTEKHKTESMKLESYEVVSVQKIVVIDKTQSIDSEHKLYVKVKKASNKREEGLPKNNFIVNTMTKFPISGNQAL